jgi:hypothetical protein
MRAVLNGAVTLGLGAIVVTILACLMGWAQSRQQ